ncbi:MAG: DNA repair protein RadC [Lentisphaeraceae bacterium]|nr:DNA repair protein RadC [Lentisphaeraceae bacterium]
MGFYTINDLPQEERPRERMCSRGEDTLSDTELLAIINSTGSHGVSAIDLSRNILNHFDGSLLKLSRASIKELCQIHGVGQAKACSIKAVFTLSRRLSGQMASEKFQIQAPKSAAEYLSPILSGKDQEEFHVILLDTRNCIERDIMITRGLLDRSHVHPREVFREAVRSGTSKVLLAHNHPSGDPSPSKQDIISNENLVEAGSILGIQVVDHIIIGHKSSEFPKGYISMRTEGLFPAKNSF